ncbi:MamI family restriction endonuclease [Bacillus paranthracis]|uniref:MamI family restriction endonuclease n=1 Tax=Bacillus paranthracis TaxID=2026186 RepID=UPI00148F279E|nr:MamI family restriction endonuclease [Bacillus paranthracis]NOP81340.1 MamI family restriction endonuclease [Bacillus paranthracis]
MIFNINEDFIAATIKQIYAEGKRDEVLVEDILSTILNQFNFHSMNIDERVSFSKIVLGILSEEDRIELAKQLLQEQVVNQRRKLAFWSAVTSQSSQINTGYIAQHLTSLVTQIPGQAMRGKGDDLIDGSEVKAANFLDSLDKQGATAPRWNFTAVEIPVMERFLNYTNIYLVSMDLNSQGNFRTRIWKVDIQRHYTLRARYQEWMEIKGYPKFNATGRRAAVNFQLFPPKNRINDNFARHGNGRDFKKLNIELENYEGSKLIFHAEEDNEGNINIFNFGGAN